jgi:hypothetical protein
MQLSYEQAGPLLALVGMAEATDRRLELEEIGHELKLSLGVVQARLLELEEAGLIRSMTGTAPRLVTAGRQYLRRRGEVEPELLGFLPKLIEDLEARRALLEAGAELVDEFRLAVHCRSEAVYVRQLLPACSAERLDRGLAINLFAAAISLLSRLSCAARPACLAEEMIALALLEQARIKLEAELVAGVLDSEQCLDAQRSLSSLFDLFEDDQALRLWSPEGLDQTARTDPASWFEPYSQVPRTGYLRVL